MSFEATVGLACSNIRIIDFTCSTITFQFLQFVTCLDLFVSFLQAYLKPRDQRDLEEPG